MNTDIKPASVTPAARLAVTAFEKHYRELHRYLTRRLPNAQDADDLAQEVFLRLLRVAHGELVRKPRAYVYGIASHVVHQFRIRNQQEHDSVIYDSYALEHLDEISPADSLDRMADELNIERQLKTALSRLSPTHQAVLLLHKRDGMSREEVAQALGLSVHTVKKYVFQALAQLRVDLDRPAD